MITDGDIRLLIRFIKERRIQDRVKNKVTFAMTKCKEVQVFNLIDFIKYCYNDEMFVYLSPSNKDFGEFFSQVRTINNWNDDCGFWHNLNKEWCNYFKKEKKKRDKHC